MTSGAAAGRVLVIGLDGATFDLLDPLLARGELPHLSELLSQGRGAVLESVYPPISAAAWPSFYTGTNPGRHGIYSFERFLPESYTARLVSSREVAPPALWDHLERAGISGIYCNIPLTYPVRRVTGVMISGLLTTPGIRSEWIYPPQLGPELAELLGEIGFMLTPSALRSSPPARALDLLNRHARAHVAAFRRLWERQEARLGVLVLESSDLAHHAFLGRALPEGPPPWELQGEAGEIIAGHYRELDTIVGELTSGLSEDDTVIVMSDHGACARRRIFCINEWLAREGYLSWQWFPRHRDAPYLWRRKTVGRTLDSLRLGGLKRYLSDERLSREVAFPRWGRMVSNPRGPRWKRTRAFADAAGTWSFGIRLNLQGRERDGLVEPGAEYDRLREEIADKLLALRDPADGGRVVERAWKREELYQGEQVVRMPDLMISFVEDRYAPVAQSRRRAVFGEQSPPMAGHHSSRGLLIAAGPSVQPGPQRGAAHLTDLAPTILRLLGLAVPPEMDGSCLEQVCRPEHNV